MRSLARTALVCLTASILAVFVWPTPYSYEKITRRGENGTVTGYLFRVNRTTIGNLHYSRQ